MVEINITPFTDIVLVILIIFMITTPVIMGGSLRVNLPGAKGTQRASDIKKASRSRSIKPEIFSSRARNIILIPMPIR